MNVTIICDASYCPDTKVGGYGFWIASERGKRGGKGLIKVQMESSLIAEMVAVCSSLHRAWQLSLIKPLDEVLLQTDCQSAIDIFEGKRGERQGQQLIYVNHFKDCLEEFGISVRFRHVKGHTNLTGARYYINRRCDKDAYEQMRIAREAVRSNLMENYKHDQPILEQIAEY